MSGKSSPCPSYSGKSSPCSTIEDVKTSSPRKKFLEIKQNPLLNTKPASTLCDINKNLKSPRANVGESFFAKPVVPGDSENVATDAENTLRTVNDNELSNIPEEGQQMSWNDMVDMEEAADKERIQQEKESERNVSDDVSTTQTAEQYSQTEGFDDDNLTLQQWRDKYESNTKSHVENAVNHTVEKLNDMENEFLSKNSNQASELINTSTTPSAPNNPLASSILRPTVTECKETTDSHSVNCVPSKKLSTQSEEKKSSTSMPPKYSNVFNRSTTSVKSISATRTTNTGKLTKYPTNTTVTARIPQPSAASHHSSTVTRRFPAKTTIISSSLRVKTNNEKNVPTVNKEQNKAANTRMNTVPTNIASRLAARSKTMIEIGNVKRNNNTTKPYKSHGLSRDSFGSSTSTLRASNDRLKSASNSQATITASSKENINYNRKSEPRSMPSKEDNDGWLTVKTKRRSSLHWANRFNQPTGYASLPTLALLNQNEKETLNNSTKSNGKKENKKVPKPATPVANRFSNIDSVKNQKSTSTINQNKNTSTKAATAKVQTKVQQTVPVKEVAAKSNPQKIDLKPKPIVSRAAIIQRQKSDVTGLKLNSLRREYLRKEKNNKLPTAIKKTEQGTKLITEDEKINMKIQANMGISSAMCDLYTSCIESGNTLKPPPLNKIVVSEKDESENDDEEVEIENDEHQKKLLEEQECLERQILELQNTEIDFDTETDDADCEVMLDLEESEDSSHATESEVTNDEDISLEMRYHSLLSDLSTDERLQTLATLQTIVSRHPGRAQELHQKLSSPSRRRSLHETLKKYQAKQSRAKDMRDLLNKEKALKIQTLLARVEDVKLAKQQLIEEKRLRMEEKLQRYAENRTQYIKHKVRKAHDEEEKLKEIAFIKNLEAQNKRLDFEELCKEQETRLQDLEQERQKRMEEKAAKEAAAERRRQELAKERQKRLEKMDETR